MDDLIWKVRISVLWLIYEVALLVYMILESAELGAIEQAGPEILLLFAVILLVPLVMAFLSLTLKGSMNRWVNIILGIGYAVFELLALSEVAAKPSAWAILMILSKLVVLALIVWYAWKWPKKEG